MYPLQEALDQDGVNGTAIRITSGVFHVWRAAGLMTGDQLFIAALGSLVLSVLTVLGGWYHYHSILPNGSWFNDLESALAHHLTSVIGLACFAWAGHLIHIAYPIEILLSCG